MEGGARHPGPDAARTNAEALDKCASALLRLLFWSESCRHAWSLLSSGLRLSVGGRARRAFRFHRRPCEKAEKESENPLNESGDLSVDILEVKLNPKPRREEGGCEIAESRTVFVCSEPPLPSLVGISEPDPNLFIIFEGISPIGPCE